MFGWLNDGEDARLAFEPRQAISMRRELVRQDLDRHVAAQPRVAGAIDLAHAANPDAVLQAIDAELPAGQG